MESWGRNAIHKKQNMHSRIVWLEFVVKKIVAIGNCQLVPIVQNILSTPELTEKYTLFQGRSVHMISEEQVKNLHEHIAFCDLLICTHVNEGYRNGIGVDTNHLLSRAKKAEKIIIVPSIYWEGQTPELCYMKNLDGSNNTELFDYHNKIIFSSYIRGYSLEETLSALLDGEKISFNTNLIETTTNNLIKREKVIRQEYEGAMEREIVTIEFSDFIIKNYTSSRLFWTFNHPTTFLINYISRLIMDLIGCNSHANMMREELLDGSFFPIHKSVYNALNCDFKNESRFKVRRKCYSPFDIVNLYFDFYKKNSDLVMHNKKAIMERNDGLSI